MYSAPSVHYINAREKNAAPELGLHLKNILSSCSSGSLPPVILCIGTDRVTGDSLGPLVGTFLQAYDIRHPPVYGTLQLPVHALNLKSALNQVKKKHPHNLIIAVDASFGSKKHLGYITLGKGSLQPGAGVQKKLASVGDIFITGIVSPQAQASQLALQNTRLSAVMSLSCCIAQGISYACDAVVSDRTPVPELLQQCL
ncbi:MAG: spore protease YyaC [Lachnospiraceae bacterium]|nr:spore protease YyaC [Lachnospiraceae bacterium]